MQSADFLLLRQSLDTKYGLHWHDFYELTFVLAGKGSQILNGKPHQLQPGTFFFLTPADFHEVSPDPGETLEMFDLVFTDENLSDDLRHLLFNFPREYNTDLSPANFKMVEGYFNLINNELKQKNPGYRLIIRGVLEWILVELFRNCQENNTIELKSQPGLQNLAIQHSLIYMHNHFRLPLTLEEVAQQARLAPNYFSECFHKVVGVSFQNYLQSLRLKFAAALLATSELPVTEVCYSSGFNTLNHFARAFKQKYGQTPHVYRHTRLFEQKKIQNPNIHAKILVKTSKH
jgi:AraC-like DNA-binding protein